MSWMSGLQGETPPPYIAPPDEEKVKDPSIPDRMVSAKSANQPFLAHAQYREQQEALHQEWLEKKKIRDLKISRGEKKSAWSGCLKFLFYATIIGVLAGKFITGSYTWEYENKLTTLKSLWPTDQRLFSERALAVNNGEDGHPAWLAIDGDVYDVSKGAAYQPGGSYHFMAGIDAARAFGTGCFETHRTHDLRGLSAEEMAGVEHWKRFFANHREYTKIGRVSHRPIDPKSPIPVHCDAKKQAKAEEAAKRKGETVHQKDEEDL
ncbi:cytochrome b5-like heme/steroid binding domain-containing protein [Mycena rebaudengoi]|nr:cytochrome b5-like heme/steroid binding domain-containing protein [Mycena rebaudengoi]